MTDATGSAAGLRLPGEAATEALAARLAALAGPGDVIALWGDLGTGKTVFARGFVRARGTADTEVPSPTFTLVQVYDPPPGRSGAVWHFDLYRVTAPEEAWELGIEEAFADGISLIEWPGRLGPLLPAGRLDVTLGYGASPDERRAELVGHGTWPRRLREAGLA
jgi:tRNA threonylcarbamoyladenosine biosynthesis protein TsaE